MFDQGIAEGIVGNKSLVNDAIADLNKSSFTGINASMDYNFTPSEENNKMDLLLSILERYLPEIAQKEGTDINDLFNGINRQLGWGLQ